MNPSRNPSWRVDTQRFASVTVAFANPPPCGSTWSDELALERADQRREGGRSPGPRRRGPTTSTRSTTPGSSVPRCVASAGTTFAIASA